MKTKVLFLIPTLENGGAEKVLVNLVNNMDLKRFEITVQTLFDYGVHKARLRPEIRYCSFISKPPFRGYSHLIRILPSGLLAKWIIRDHYDVVISYLEGSSAWITKGCQSKETKVVSWIHTVMDTERRLKIGFLTSKQALKTYKSADRLVFVSQSALKAFSDTSGCTSNKFRVIYNTNESDYTKVLAKEKTEDIHFKSEEFNICSVGKITPNKGFDRLARIAASLRKEGYPVHVYAVGEGEQCAEIKQFLQKEGLSDYYTFLGYQQNPYKYISACDLYVCASYREGFSTAVTEALIVGTPVVSTNCSGAHELLGYNNEYGIVVDNTDQGILEGIRRMVSDKNLLATYKKQAVIRGASFSAEKTVKAVEDLIEEVMLES